VLNMMPILLSFLLLPGDSNLTAVEIQKLAPVGGGDSLSLPVEVVIDKENRLYILDAGAKCLFVWNADGSFLTRLGREGDGPGEFRFMDPGRCELGYDGEQVIVLDDKALKWHTFKGTEFQKTTLKDNKLARIGYFKCLTNGKYVIWEQEHRGAVAWSKVYITELRIGVRSSGMRGKGLGFRVEG